MNLSTMQSSKQMWNLLGLHQAAQYMRWFGLHPSEESSTTLIKSVTASLVESLSPYASGVLLEPHYGYAALDKKAAEVGVAFEVLTVKDDQPLPTIIKGWGVEQTASNYAVVCASVPYHPQMQDALERKKLVFELADYCQYEGVDFLLNLQMKGIGGDKIHPDELPDAQLSAVQEFRGTAGALILDYPGSSLAAATLTAEVDVPWLMRSAVDQGYESFKTQLREALESGARGFVASDPIWGDISKFRHQDMSPDLEKIQEFLATTARDRIIELSRISDEHGD